jgi:serine/threonine protein kinase/tetratricopeptide (TPR) repeat protein
MDDWQNLEKAIFFKALELPAQERNAYVKGACRGDAALEKRVQDLLVASQGSGSGAGQRETEAEEATGSATESVEGPGSRIGHYKLLENIGEGGMGVVYMAEQREPVVRKVALKIIKLGMDTRQVVARFEAERQALALMDHPNIAKVLDAGATKSGRPYFVMELVQGIPITRFCDEAQLDTEGRLNLFTQVCSAIQHAHQKGVIHRDVKPSNVLVTLIADQPVPKVIDFGIAKSTQQPLTDKTLFTRFQHFIGTPAYMSPEQAGLSGLDIDTRSDIYGLGVLLYELLTGKTPFDGGALLAAGFEEIRRIIREVEPPKPSTRLSTMKGQELATTARQRRADPKKLGMLIRGDLDRIVMKALEKDRARRYETANGMAADIKRFLRHEPVTAVAPSAGYRFRKFVQRHRASVTLAAAIVFVAIVAFGAVTWQWGRAKANEKLAREEATKSAQVAKFLKDMLQGVRPSVAQGRDTTMLREILDKTAERVSKDLRDQPAVAAELHNTLGEVYFALAQYEPAEASFRQALAELRTRFGNNQLEVAESLNNLAAAFYARGDLDQAERIFREALAIRRKIVGDEHAEVANSLNNLAELLRLQGKQAESEATHRQALAIRRKLFGNEHPDVAVSLHNLGLVLSDEGRLLEAETADREALALRRRFLGNADPDLALTLNNLAAVLQQQTKLAEAEAMYREALAVQRKVMGDEHPYLAYSLHNLATVLRGEGKLAEAEIAARDCLRIREKKLPDDWQTFFARSLLGAILLEQSNYSAAEPFLISGYEGMKQRREKIPTAAKPRFKEAIEQVVKLYEFTSQYDKAANWRERLAEYQTNLVH